MNTVATRLKELRSEKGLTQSGLGKLLNVSQDTVSLWEKGKSLPNTEYIIALSKLYGVSADYILGLSEY